ncbi:MAG: hypothetical protein WD749_01040 [Phycisphaerales bacterium]
MKTRALLKPAAVGLAMLTVATVAYLKLYHWPRSALVESIQKQRVNNAGYEAHLARAGRLNESLRKLAADTIGTESETATSRFRTGLGEIGKSCGLAVTSVNSHDPERMVSPAAAKVKDSLAGELKKQTDFRIIRGQLSGTGTLDQALRTMATVQAQPWVHRVEGFTLKPQDKERQRFLLTLDVTTMLIPEFAPRNAPEPRIVPLDPLAVTRWAGIVRKNPFREPAMEVARADTPPPAPAGPAAPPPPPWGEWKLTGVAESPRRPVEALMVNTRTSESVVLNVGSAITGATFTGGSRGRGIFEIGGERFEVLIGQTLEQRSPAGR